MADKQLTVAELMARAQKENPDAQPRRRRRRSLDEGGISVAELTGSLKAVDARPAEVKHSSVPIDAENEKPKAPQKPKQTTPKPAEKKAEPVKPEVKKPEAPKPAAVKPETSKQDAKPAQPKPEVAKSADQKPAAKKEEALSRSSFKAVAPQPKQTEQTGPISRVVSLDDAKQKQVEETGEIPVVDKPGTDADLEATQEHPVVADEPAYDGSVEEYEEDVSVNPILLVLLVFAGLAVGVLVFLGFQYLWGQFNPILVGVLALVATGGAVLLVRAMKTGRDALTMTLAAIAGAAMTFGPALIALA